MTASPDDRTAQVDQTEIAQEKTSAKRAPAKKQTPTAAATADETSSAPAVKKPAAKRPAAKRPATTRTTTASAARKPAAAKASAAKTGATKAAAEKAAPTAEVVVEPLVKAMPGQTSEPSSTTSSPRSATAARSAAAKNTTAAKATTAAKTTAAKTTAAKTAAARTAATKAAASKSTARSAAAKTTAAKTTAAKAAAAKKAAAKKAADAAAKAAADTVTAAPEATPVIESVTVETAPAVELTPTADSTPAAIEQVTVVDTAAVEPAVVEPAVVETAVVETSVVETAAVAEATVASEPVEAKPVEAKPVEAGPAEAAAAVEPDGSVEIAAAAAESDDAASGAVDPHDAGSAGEAISIRGLVKQFGDNRAVDGIDLTVPAGSFYGVVGPNGAGKTTTLSIVAGLLRADAGSVVICGIDQAKQPLAAKRLMGVLPDRLRTFDRLTGRQLLYYYGLLRGLAADVIEKRAADLARAFDLGDALSRVVSDYSAGMTKKIMLAGAMIHSPRVLVLDEPFESVDPVSSAVILDILRAYVSHGGTVILSSHGMDLVERVCSRVAIIVGGEVLAEGTIDEVRAGQTLEARFVELAGSSGEVEGLEWLHTFSD